MDVEKQARVGAALIPPTYNMGVNLTEGKNKMPTKLVEAGIDYVRLTSNNPLTVKILDRVFVEIAIDEQRAGYEIKNGGMIGFFGRKTKHAFFGMREDWCMFQVSGRAAQAHLKKFWHVEANCTRIDIQHTIRTDDNIGPLLTVYENQSCEAKSPNGKHWDTDLRRHNRENQTLYIGSRTSEWYGRVYDKFAESKKEEYKGCVRFEVEVKGDASRAIWDGFVRGSISLSKLVGIVPQWYRQHGLSVPGYEDWQGEAVIQKPAPTSIQRRLGWLAKMVSGTVSKLADEGYFWEATQALFRQALTSRELEGILFYKALSFYEV